LPNFEYIAGSVVVPADGVDDVAVPGVAAGVADGAAVDEDEDPQ
jgi:hypothetical protein